MAMISAREATAADLDTINGIIAGSIVSWELPDRVRRLAEPSLRYNEMDLQHMAAIVFTDPQGSGVALAAWEDASGIDVPENRKGVLIHGLYVVPGYQRRGLGTRLIELVANRVGDRHGEGMAVRAWRDSLAFFLSRGFAPVRPEDTSARYPRRLWRALR